MKIIKFVKNYKILNSINLFRSFIIEKLIFLKNFKIKRKIRGSYQTESLVEKFFPKSLNFEKNRAIFFKKNLFAYSNTSEIEDLMKFLNKNCPEEIKNYIECAEKVIRNEFSIFEKNYCFKNKIKWHYSFFQDYYWKLKKSEKIDIRPKKKDLDVKYVWEFNRHNFLPYLGVAYYFTKNEKYAKKFKQIILDWIKKNPPLYGINWYSGLEISIRLISWIFSLFFFKESKEINNKNFFSKIFCSMFQHAYFLRYFYTRHSFNHTIGDIFGVYLFSKIFEDIEAIKKWERIFFKKFTNQIFLQTRPDGTNIEQSVNYHRFVLEFFSLFAILHLNVINDLESHLIEKMYDYLLYIIKPNGTFPLIGDIDDGKVLPLTNNPFIDLINLGSILFNRGDLKYLSKKISPISILLLGLKGNHQFEKIQIQRPSDSFKIFKSKDIIIDSGTYTYNKSWDERNYFRSSKAHNVLAINQKNQSKFMSWFGWEYKPKIKRKFLIENDKIEFDCFHDGYKGFIVHRKIITEKNVDKIIIKDTIFKNKKINDKEVFDINIYYHFNKRINAILENNVLYINKNLKFRVNSTQDIDINLEKAFYAPNYGSKVEISLLNIHLKHSFENKNPIIIKSEIEPLN